MFPAFYLTRSPSCILLTSGHWNELSSPAQTIRRLRYLLWLYQLSKYIKSFHNPCRIVAWPPFTRIVLLTSRDSKGNCVETSFHNFLGLPGTLQVGCHCTILEWVCLGSRLPGCLLGPGRILGMVTTPATKIFMQNANMIISASFTPKHINLVCFHMGILQISRLLFAHSA